jgi:hypothetical protein
VTEHNVVYAALECVITLGGVASEPLWFQLGALIKVNSDAEIREHNWTQISNYVHNIEPDIVENKNLFRLVTVNPKSAKQKRRTARQSMLGTYFEPDNKNIATCVLPDGTHFSYPLSDLDTVIVHSNTAQFRVSRASAEGSNPSPPTEPTGTFVQHDNSPVTKNTYCPHSYPEILKCVNAILWMNAVKNCVSELQSMNVGTFKKLKDLSPDAKPITSRFVCQIKMNHECQKLYAFARWTPRGFQQQPDTPGYDDGHYDPDNVFAGTPSLSLLRILMAKKCLNRWKSFHFDFKRAFSSTKLERTIDVLMPKGYTMLDEDGDELYLELDHSCEGLKQSGANWLKKITTFLLSYGFKQSVTEPKLFTKDLPNNGRCEFMLYIDDILCISNSPSFVQKFYNDLNNFSPCKNQGEIVSTLGIELEHTPTSVSLSCCTQIDKLLFRHDMTECSGRHIPIPPTFNIAEALDNEPLNNYEKQIFQSLVGSFLYIARNTRPDIYYATWLLACAMSKPTKPCLKAAFYLLRYLKQSKHLKLTYKFSSSSELVAMNFEQPLPIHCDNRGAIENAKHPILKDNLKHVAIREFYVRDSIVRGTVAVHKIRGTMNPADIGTKLLSQVLYNKYCGYLLNVSGSEANNINQTSR